MALTVRPGSAVNISEAKRHARLLAARESRRRSNMVRRLHHHAVRTDDMEATRRFYEDLLGLPLVACLKGKGRASGDEEIPLLHCLFELGDGSALAFFQLAPGKGPPADRLPRDGVDHHIAVAVPDHGDLVRLKARLEEAGFPTCGINHGVCYSLYVRDPNGMLLELTADAADELDRNETGAAEAHEMLAEWLAGICEPSGARERSMMFPLATSPREQIQKIVRGAID